MPTLESRLLLVTDRQQANGQPLLSVLSEALKAGVSAVQLRERDLSSRDLLALAHELSATMGSCAQLVINDRIDVALSLEGVGVHLRSNSLPVSVARRLLGPQRLLGASAHSVEEVRQAESEGADYIVFGPIYETPSKISYGPPLGLHKLQEACTLARVPVVAIGGITAVRVRDVCRAGAFGVAVVAAILRAPDVTGATREMLDALAAAS
jgi:thiamine-phosphate pyrophosphorylase